MTMIKFLLDVKDDPVIFEKHGNAKWLIIVAIAALVGLVAWFIIKKRKENKS